jgi:hypothetical protein
MNPGTQVETSLALAVDGTTKILQARIDEAVQLSTTIEAYIPVSPILISLASNRSVIADMVSQAAFAELLFIVQQSTNADGDLDLRELEAAVSLLSRSKWRWFRGCDKTESGYGRFERLHNAETLAYMIMHWQEDSGFLGGNFAGGAIQFPFTLLVAVASVVDKDTSLLGTWVQVLQFVSSVICDVDGVNWHEDEWLKRIRRICSSHMTLADLHIRKMQLESQPPALAEVTKADREPSVAPENDDATRKAALEEASEQLKALIGVPRVKSEVASLTNFLNVRAQRLEAGLPVPTQALHFVFTGNPGTGKTTVARIISKILFGFGILKSATFIEADRSRLVGGFVGQTAIKTSEVIDEAVNGVLFIDEAYALTQNESGQDYGREAVDTLLKRMEDLRDRLVVIVAGYPEKMKAFVSSNPGLQSRFTRFMHFDDYSPAELCRIFEKLCSESHYGLTVDARANAAILYHLAHLQRSSSFGNARFVRNFFEATLRNHANRLASSAEPVTKDRLATLEATDLPYSMVEGISAQFDVRGSKWRVQCPHCQKKGSAAIAFIGNRVVCSCGARFRCPWWNLVPGTVPGLEGYTPSINPEDLLGCDLRAQ